MRGLSIVLENSLENLAMQVFTRGNPTKLCAGRQALLPVWVKATRFTQMSHPKFDFSNLSPEERIQLAEDLWDSLDDRPEILPLTDAQARRSMSTGGLPA